LVIRSRTSAGDLAKRTEFRRRCFSRKKIDGVGYKRSLERARIGVPA
jgi:hypothetical protein